MCSGIGKQGGSARRGDDWACKSYGFWPPAVKVTHGQRYLKLWHDMGVTRQRSECRCRYAWRSAARGPVRVANAACAACPCPRGGSGAEVREPRDATRRTRPIRGARLLTFGRAPPFLDRAPRAELLRFKPRLNIFSTAFREPHDATAYTRFREVRIWRFSQASRPLTC